MKLGKKTLTSNLEIFVQKLFVGVWYNFQQMHYIKFVEANKFLWTNLILDQKSIFLSGMLKFFVHT